MPCFVFIIRTFLFQNNCCFTSTEWQRNGAPESVATRYVLINRTTEIVFFFFLYEKLCSPRFVSSPSLAILAAPLVPSPARLSGLSPRTGQCSIDAVRGSVSYGSNKPSLPLLDPLVARGCCVFLTDRDAGRVGRDITGEGKALNPANLSNKM